MNKLLFLCCINIFCVIAAPVNKNDIKIYDLLQHLEVLQKCPAVLTNNIAKEKSNGGLSHCKDVAVENPPESIDYPNINEFYCIGLLAADIQLCTGNKTNKLPASYDDLKINLELIKQEKPDKICGEFKQLLLFNETVNGTLKKWIEFLDKNLRSPKCHMLCEDIETGNTNLLCSMLYYVNNNVSYVQQIVTTPPQVQEITPKQQSVTNAVKQINSDTNVNGITDVLNKAPEVSQISSSNQKNNPTNEVSKVEPVTSKKVEVPVQKEDPVQKSAPVQKPAPVAPVVPLKPEIKEDPVVKNVQIIEKEKPAPVENPIPEIPVEERPKIPSNVESSSVSSTISGIADDFADDYNDENEETNKENDVPLLQTNIHKEKIEILPNDQEDSHNMPSDDVEEMEESNFFSYFMFISVMFIAGYVVYHNKQKIMALLLEGRRDRNSRRRPNTASYRKLNSNLEEAVTSKCSGSASHVIY